ncbi:hypothetical protein P4H39_19855 [Paenibacillus lautus]|uniref:hypothetical protein n=1 Tax=Paenibacillus lautus TaxID=1401 RepID=UPI002DBF1A87|nr:hypothetical protein [Paenibacillus lautus]MEC0204865.1 hypothetical protein [Paenibacillus lautus]
MKRTTVLIFRQAQVVLQIRVLQNLLHGSLSSVPSSCMIKGSERNADGYRFLALQAAFEIFRAVLFDLPPGCDLGEQDPSIILCEFSAKRQEEIAG